MAERPPAPDAEQRSPLREDDIIVDSVAGVRIVRLNRSSRANSVTPEVVTALGDAVAAACADVDVEAVVLTGTGRVFCAGADVAEMHTVYVASGADGLMDYLAQVWMPAVQRTVRLLWGASKPLVAAFNGAATAGGLDFGLTCDARIAVPRARFAESYVNLGMVPVAGGVFLLPRLVGPTRALRMLATGRLVAAEEAERIGLVDEVCEVDRLIPRAAEIAGELAHGPAQTYARTKAAARLAETPQLHAALVESLQANIDLIGRGDVRDRMVEVMERYSDAP